MGETIISDFQAGHSWVKYGVPGTVVDDPTVFMFGSQSLKLTTDGAAGECKIRWSGCPAIDLTSKFFKLWVRIKSVANLNRLWLYAGTTDYSNVYAWKPSDAPSHYVQSNDTWLPITFSFGQATSSGSPNRATLNQLQLYAQDKNATPVEVWWGGLHTIDWQTPGKCTISFDDGWVSQFSEAYAYMQPKGLLGQCFIIPSVIGNAGYLTAANIDALYAAGWDIAGHGATNLDVVPDLDVELSGVRTYLLGRGYSRSYRDYAYPGGVFNEGTVLPKVKQYFRASRSIIPYSETRPVNDWYKLRVLTVTRTTAPATVATAVTRAINNNEWLILIFHKIVAAPSVSTEYAIADFQAVIDNIAAQGISVVRLSDMYPSAASKRSMASALIADGSM